MSREPPIVSRALDFDERVALSDDRGTYTYDFIHSQSVRVACGLLGDLSDLAGARVAFLVPPELEYVLAQWGVWRAGGIAVPLCMAHPRPELEYVIDDCQPDLLLASRATLDRLKPIARSRELELHEVSDLRQAPVHELPSIAAERPAMIVYTSGTTGGPKGVVTTHANISAQIGSLIEAWEWVSGDRIRLVLPLHHVHGIVNVLGCALWSGARCDMADSFDAAEVWESFVDTEPTLFMAVPTIYAKLAAVWQQADRGDRERWTRAARNLRLMVSGSAALPEQLFDLWFRITGHRLLERYGMTEIGMALSNPLHGERLPGHVGQPLPGVDVRRVDAEGDPVADDTPGEIEVRGATVFREYWQRPTETAGAFRQGWFRTGDISVVDRDSYRILGRQSVDIIKTGGYKVSALEIEEVLRSHPSVLECAVVGVADPVWGERVAVGVEVRGEGNLELDDLRSWAKERLASYKVPTRLLLLEQLPRNPMGKVVKPKLRALVEQAETSSSGPGLR